MTALVEKAREYIAEHSCDGIRVADVVLHLGVSRSLLELRFRQVCGKSVNEDILEGTLTIYNRHGLKVYSSSDPGVGWDGTHNGTPCPQGAYPWYFRYRTVIDPDRWHEVTGTVTLLR